MPYPQIDRSRIRMSPLATRRNRVRIERDHVPPAQPPGALPTPQAHILAETIDRIHAARRAKAPVMLAFGAHTIKNGLGPVLIQLMQEGWVTHLATNGAGIIHDWEFAFLGQSSEEVQPHVADGTFGHWEETGFYLNLALNIGAMEGKGYGEAIGAMIQNDGLLVPALDELASRVRQDLTTNPERAAASAEGLEILRRFDLAPGFRAIPHPWKQFSAQAAAYRIGIPFTGHPMIGHDIIYNHPMNHGALLGRAALRDFLAFAESVSRIEGGVYISVGSAVMSPMIFEKSFSMAQNLARQESRKIESHYLLVVDLLPSQWDWGRGEPPEKSPEYYLRFNKTFNRMGGTMRYLTCDNRDFLLNLCHGLK